MQLHIIKGRLMNTKNDLAPSAIKLISFDLCPYVQRAAIVLLEKNVAFERITIDLANKPEWFRKISPLGKVPVLQQGGDVLFESTVIVEYLEEVYEPALHPADPMTKARQRAWMEFGSSMLADLWVIETSQDAEAFEIKCKLLRSKAEQLELELKSSGRFGPYFAGPDFSIVDAVYAPFFRYFNTIEMISSIRLFEGLPHIGAWRTHLALRPSVRQAVVADYDDRLLAFLRKHNGVLMRNS
jgi:glutathione S-transferase